MNTYQFIKRLILYRPVLYLVNALSWTLIHTYPVIPGLILREFLDTLSGQSRLDLGIWGIIALLVATTVAHIANIVVGALIDIGHRFSISALLRRNTLESILTSPGKAQSKSIGEVLNIFEEDGKQVEDAISWSVDMIGMTGFALVSAAILVRVSPQLTLMVFLPLIIVTMIAQSASKRLEKYRKESRKATSLVTEAMGEAFSSVQAIKVASAEESVTRHLKLLGQKRKDAMLKDKLLSRVLDSVFDNTSKIGTGVVLLLAARYLRLKTLSVGDFALFVYYLQYITEFAAFFGYFTVHIKQSGVSLARFSSIVGKPEELVQRKPLFLKEMVPQLHFIRPDQSDRLESLAVSGLTARHLDTGRGVQDLSFTLERGTFTVITGKVGSGKTTLVRALLGLIPLETGRIFWNGKEVRDPRSFFRPPRSAYAPQVPHLFSDKLSNNVLMGLPENEVDLEAAIKAAVLEEDLHDLEKGMETIIGPKGTKLSGGQQQRTAVARMLVRQTELLVFDDVSSALDVETERQLWEALARKSQATSLVVSNRRGAIMRADQVLVMEEGKIVAQGKPERLLETSPGFRAILDEVGEDAGPH